MANGCGSEKLDKHFQATMMPGMHATVCKGTVNSWENLYQTATKTMRLGHAIKIRPVFPKE